MKSFTLIFVLLSFAYLSKAQTIYQKTVNSSNSNYNSIIIDGNLDESAWYTNFYSLKNQINVGEVNCENNPNVKFPINDNNVSFATFWDEIYLYIGIKVLDDTLISYSKEDSIRISNGGSSNANNGDALQLFLSMDNNRSSNCPKDLPRSYGVNDFQLIYFLDGQITSPQAMEIAVEYKKANLDGGYSLEIRLSWAELDFWSGLQPESGRVIGFDIANDDIDAKGQNNQSQLMWNQCCTNRNWIETMNFGKLVLGGWYDSPGCANSPVVKNQTICSPGSITLTASASDQISWYSKQKTIVATGAEFAIPYLSKTDTFFVTAINKDGCESSKVRVLAVLEEGEPVKPDSIKGDTIMCKGYIGNYRAITKEIENFKWAVSGGEIKNQSNGVDASITWLEQGEHLLSITPFNECKEGEALVKKIIVVDGQNLPTELVAANFVCPGTLSLNNSETESAFKIYPNPSTGTLNLEIPNVTGQTNVSLINMRGEIVQKISLSHGILNFTFKDLNSGLYLIEFTTNNGKVTRKKIIVEN